MFTRCTYHVHLEHIEQTFHELLRGHDGSLIELLLSQVIVVMHWLQPNIIAESTRESLALMDFIT